MLVPMPTYPLYTAVIAKLGAHALYLPDRSRPRVDAGSRSPRDRSSRRATRALVVIDPNNPTGATYSTASAARDSSNFAERHGLRDPRRRGLRRSGLRRPGPPIGRLDPDAPIISFSSLSKAYLAPGWRTGWLRSAGRRASTTWRRRFAKLADGRLCSTVPMQYAVTAALDRRQVAPGDVPRGAEGARRR